MANTGGVLANKVVLITGASSGLGASLATYLAGEGATVLTLARRVEQLKNSAAESPSIHPHRCDITNEAELAEVVDDCVRTYGRIDVLVNNAGKSVQQASEDASIEDFRGVLELNLVAQFNVTRLVARSMLTRGGSIINIASVFGLVASAPLKQAAYVASKGGLIALTRHLAVEWADRGVRVNAIAPGFFQSELTSELFADDKSLAWLRRNTPLGRAGKPAELNGVVRTLASDDGGFITGTVITVDGGWTAR